MWLTTLWKKLLTLINPNNGGKMSPNPILADLKAAVDRTEDVAASAVVLLNGIAARIQAAIDAALANGATEAELQPLIAELSELNASTDALAAAVAANT